MILLVLPIPIFWASTLVLHACLNSGFYWFSTKNTLIHLLSTSTWVTIPVKQMESWDQKQKGREIFFEFLLAGIFLVETSATLAITIEAKFVDALLFLVLPPLFLHLAGCGLLLLFEKTVRPWRDLGKERERHCEANKEYGVSQLRGTRWVWTIVFFLQILREAPRMRVWKGWSQSSARDWLRTRHIEEVDIEVPAPVFKNLQEIMRKGAWAVAETLGTRIRRLFSRTAQWMWFSSMR